MFYFVVFRFLPFSNKKKNYSFFVICCFAAAARAARPNEDKLRKRGRFNLFFIAVTCLRSAAIFSCLSLCLSITDDAAQSQLNLTDTREFCQRFSGRKGQRLPSASVRRGAGRSEMFAACQKRFPSTFFPPNLFYFIFGCCHEKAASLHHAATKWKVRMNKSDFRKVEKLQLAAVQDLM